MGLMILDDVRIASPCRARWEEMTGTDRVRFCAACQKNVFNLSGMKRSEAQELLTATEGKICARFYRRADGTMLTADCPIGFALVARRAKRLALGAVATTLGAVATALAFLATTPMRKVVNVEGARQAVTVTVQRVEEQHSALVVPEPAQMPLAGGIAPIPMPAVQHPHAHRPAHRKPPQPVPAPEPFMGDIDSAASTN